VDLLEDDEEFAAEFNQVYYNLEVAETEDQFDPDSFNGNLNMELAINRGGEYPKFVRVTKKYVIGMVTPSG